MNIESIRKNVEDQKRMIEFLDNEDKRPFETLVILEDITFVYIGNGVKIREEYLGTKYNIPSNHLYCIEIGKDSLYMVPDNVGMDENLCYFVEKSYFDKYLNRPKPKPIELNLRVVTIDDVSYVSIGKGSIVTSSLSSKYNIPLEEIHRIVDDGVVFENCFGFGDKIEYWVKVEFYLRNLEKFQKDYKVVEVKDKRFVSIGKGSEGLPLYVKYAIPPSRIFRLVKTLDTYNPGQYGWLEDREYYVEEDYYLKNKVKFERE